VKFIIQWTEGRKERSTETEIPEGLNWEDTQKYIISLAAKSYKYSDEPVPEGLDVNVNTCYD
tara:strand:+ start:1831 stop:2016 length:186 start_codon:yes stop_codon:yes gene_type:complete